MRGWDDTPDGSPPPPDRSYQGIRDPARSDAHGNDVAQRHHRRSKLSRVAESRETPEDDTDIDVTAALAPQGAGTEWPGPLPGAEPLPGQLDRWLATRGAELVA